MKTKLLSKAIALGALVLLFLVPIHIKAQYQVLNNLPCNVTIRFAFFSPSATGCNNPCPGPGGSGSIIIPPGPPPTIIPFPAGCVFCGIRIAIVAVNGVLVVPPIIAGANIPPTPPHASGPDPSGCSPTGNINLDVFPNTAHINP
jgi:hypothetical protein